MAFGRTFHESSKHYMDTTVRHLQEALPYTLGRVTVSLVESLFEPRSVRVDVLAFHNTPFYYHMIDLPYLSPEELAHEVGRLAAVFYRNLPGLPVEDHIVLGEN